MTSLLIRLYSLNTSKNLNSKNSLYNETFDQEFGDKVMSKLQELKLNKQATPAIDKDITEDEVLKNISKLPNRKAAGLDGIINEMIKAGTRWSIYVTFQYNTSGRHFPRVMDKRDDYSHL